MSLLFKLTDKSWLAACLCVYSDSLRKKFTSGRLGSQTDSNSDCLDASPVSKWVFIKQGRTVQDQVLIWRSELSIVGDKLNSWARNLC